MSRVIKILAALAIIFAGASAVVLRGTDALSAVFRSAQPRDFLSGALAGKVDRAVFDAVPRSAALNGFAAGLMYRGIRDAGAQVRAGCGDWLYSIEELREDRQDAERIAARAELLRYLMRAALQQNVLLVAVPMPDKAEQVEAELCGLSADRSRFRRQHWAQATAGLDLHQIDLRNGWPRPGYWRTDTHWDNVGARFAAQHVAAAIDKVLGAGNQDVRLVEGEKRQRPGDLARLAELSEAPRWLAPAPEYEDLVKAEIARSGGLLDEVQTPSVILAGSSFSMNSGFAEYLQTSLRREVAQVSEVGGGFAGALLKVLQSPGKLTGVKVVIWEWPMRSLVAPLSDAERQAISKLKGLS